MKKTIIGFLLAFVCLLAGGAQRSRNASLFTGFAAIRFFDPSAPDDIGRAVTVWVMFPDDEPRTLDSIRAYLRAADRVVVDYSNGNDKDGTGIY